LYIRSFISDVNKILDRFETKCLDKEEFRKRLDSELLHIIALVEKEDIPKEKIREVLLTFHDKIESLLENSKG